MSTTAQLRGVVAEAARLSSLAAKYAPVDLGAGFLFDQVPPMTREEATAAAREAYHRSGRSAYLFTSGGSTGEPHLAWIPAGLHLDEIEPHWQPFTPGDVVANLAMPGRLWSAHLFYNRLAERVGAGVIGLGHVDDAELPGWADFLDAQGATAVVGTPGQLATLLGFLAETRHGLLGRLRTGVWFGEPYNTELEALVRGPAAHVALHGNYGSTETWVIGHNGPGCATDCFHVLPYQHLDLVGGAVLVTCLHPDAVGPVIRYEIGDRGEWATCRCGGPALRLLGRDHSLVKFAGTLVDPGELARVAAAQPGVRGAQIVLTEERPGHVETLELRLVADPSIDPMAVRERVLAVHIDLAFGLRGQEDAAMPVRIVDRLERVGRTAKTPSVLRGTKKEEPHMHTSSPPEALVVLGAMFAFRYPHLVTAAAERGLAVLAIDSSTRFSCLIDGARRSDPTHPLAGYADLAWLEGEAHEEVIEQVLEWSRSHRIRGVLAMEEGFVRVAGLVADLLDLRSPGLLATRVCRDKHLQRRYLPQWSPRSQLTRSGAALAWADFPAVVKPVGREASSGVRRVDDPAGLAEALATYDPGEDLLVEELVTGHEVSVESLVQGGMTLFSSITGKVTTEATSAYFVELGHTVPDQDLDAGQRQAVLDANQAVLRRLEFADGIAHAEYRIRADGSVVLMEIAARTPGDNIGVLYHLACGEPLETALLDIVLGEPASYPAPVRCARGVYYEHRHGVLRDVVAPGMDVPVTWLSERWAWPAVHPAGERDEPGRVHMIVVGRDPGYRLTAIRQSADRVVMSVIDAPTASELDDLHKRSVQAVRIVAGP